jgi:hypothetical protein
VRVGADACFDTVGVGDSTAGFAHATPLCATGGDPGEGCIAPGLTIGVEGPTMTDEPIGSPPGEAAAASGENAGVDGGGTATAGGEEGAGADTGAGGYQ